MPRDCTGKGYLSGMISPFMLRDPIVIIFMIPFLIYGIATAIAASIVSNAVLAHNITISDARAKRLVLKLKQSSPDLHPKIISEAIGVSVKEAKNVVKVVNKTIESEKPYLVNNNTTMYSNKNGVNRMKQASNTMRQVTVPAAKSMMVRGKNRPNFSTGSKGLIVRHSELIGVLQTAATTYTTQAYVVNPGRVDVFPWLSNIASNYDMYKLISCTFKLVSSTGTAQSGRCGIGYDYDSSDAAPTSRVDFYSMAEHAEGPVWSNLSLTIPCRKTELFVNTHTATDSKLIDNGQVVLYCDGFNGVVGDLIVEYEVELLRPQPATYATQTINVITSSYLGVIITRTHVFASSNFNITLPAGRYLISANLTGTTLAHPGAVFFSSGGTTIEDAGVANAAATSLMVSAIVNVTANSAACNMNITYATLTAGQCVITRVSGELTQII